MGAVDAARAIVADGTPESAWRGWDGLDRCDAVTLDDLVPRGERAVVVTPHPDDEVLACGGLVAMLAARGDTVEIVAVTDGDASHPGSTEWPAHRLAPQRAAESVEGLRRLGCAAPQPTRLSFPDGRVAPRLDDLVSALRGLLQSGDRVFTTWALDGHPDHEATAAAVQRACADVGARPVQAPVWMWHWAAPADAQVPWDRLRRLPLSADALRRKRAAIDAHRTQLMPQDGGREAILRPALLERLLRPYECFFIAPR